MISYSQNKKILNSSSLYYYFDMNCNKNYSFPEFAKASKEKCISMYKLCKTIKKQRNNLHKDYSELSRLCQDRDKKIYIEKCMKEDICDLPKLFAACDKEEFVALQKCGAMQNDRVRENIEKNPTQKRNRSQEYFTRQQCIHHDELSDKCRIYNDSHTSDITKRSKELIEKCTKNVGYDHLDDCHLNSDFWQPSSRTYVETKNKDMARCELYVKTCPNGEADECAVYDCLKKAMVAGKCKDEGRLKSLSNYCLQE